MHVFKVYMFPIITAPLLLSYVDRSQALFALAVAVPVFTKPFLRVRLHLSMIFTTL